MTPKVEELLPCPFCGRAPDTDNTLAVGTTIYCAHEDCGGARIFVSLDETGHHGEEAIFRWNRRRSLSARAMELEAALRPFAEAGGQVPIGHGPDNELTSDDEPVTMSVVGCSIGNVSVADFERARAAFQPNPKPQS